MHESDSHVIKASAAPEGDTRDPMPTEPGDDEVDDIPYLSDDPDAQRDGVHQTVLDSQRRNAALRDELARQLETLLEDTQDWLELTSDDDAEEIYNLMTDLYERLGEPREDTDV
jgi:tryptophanyl-tRNA synthetase